MKKTIAAVGATVLGLGGAMLAGAAPANAVTPNCTDATGHGVNANLDVSTDSWYMTCIPRYGMGKAEFTITTDSAHPFPDGYALTDAGQKVVSSSPSQSAVEAYFGPLYSGNGTPKYSGSFADLFEITGTSTSTTQNYGIDPAFSSGTPAEAAPMTAAYPILSVGRASALPAACAPDGETYDGAYVVTYGPSTTTFAETIDNVIHKVTVTSTPAPLYLGLNFTGAPGSVELDQSSPICASSGGNTLQSDSGESGSPQGGFNWINDALNATSFPPFMTTLTPDIAANDPTDPNDPNFALVASNFGTFASTSTPVLATTGVDPTAGGALGLGLLSAGGLTVLLGAIWRRRARIVSQ